MTPPIERLPSLDLATLDRIDTVIDVRSPEEFAQDHVPGAVNLPVLSDAQRAEVGRTYVQEDRFLARRRGAAMVSRNIAAHLEGSLSGKGGGWRPLLYCWRGGQRSASFATVLAQVGWRTAVLEGGYKTYRRGVVERLHAGPLGLRLVRLEGGTGVGKTELLAALTDHGMQVVDLEALAAHRGSVLGAWPHAAQPPQRLFESRLLAAFQGLDPLRPVVVEAESSKVGDLFLPPSVWAAMRDASVIEITAPLDARVRRLVAAYGQTADDPDRFAQALDRLPRHIPGEVRRGWRDDLAAGRLTELAQGLITQHYDPSYARHAAPTGEAAISTGAGSPHDLSAAAREVERRICDLGGAAPA